MSSSEKPYMLKGMVNTLLLLLIILGFIWGGVKIVGGGKVVDNKPVSTSTATTESKPVEKYKFPSQYMDKIVGTYSGVSRPYFANAMWIIQDYVSIEKHADDGKLHYWLKELSQNTDPGWEPITLYNSGILEADTTSFKSGELGLNLYLIPDNGKPYRYNKYSVYYIESKDSLIQFNCKYVNGDKYSLVLGKNIERKKTNIPSDTNNIKGKSPNQDNDEQNSAPVGNDSTESYGSGVN